MKLTFRSEDFRGAQLKLPLKVATPSTVQWSWTMPEGARSFSIAFVTNVPAGVRFVHGTKIDGGSTPIVFPQPSASAKASTEIIQAVGPVLASQHSGRVELEGSGEVLISWEKPADAGGPKWPFRTAEASLKYCVTVCDTSELRVEEDRLQLEAEAAAAVREAKVAELRGKAAEAGTLASSLLGEGAALKEQAERQQAEVQKLLAAFEEQHKRVEAEQARLAAMLPPLDAARGTLEGLLARHEDTSARAQNAAAWQKLCGEECALFASGKWVFKGWKGGGVP